MDKAYLLPVRKTPGCWGANWLKVRIVDVHRIQSQQKLLVNCYWKLSLCMPWSHMREAEVQLHTFLTCWVESAWLYSWTLFWRARSLKYPLSRCMGGPQGRCDLMAGIEPRLLCRTVAYSLSTELSRLLTFSFLLVCFRRVDYQDACLVVQCSVFH